MSSELSAPPVLSTPDDHILEALPPSTPDQTSDLTDAALRSVYEIDRTVAEIHAGRWKRIALQFPDSMLVDAPRIAETLSLELKRDGSGWNGRIYILADTSYGACCVDEVAAEHADAEVVVHYGRACLSPTSRLPVVYVYTTRELDCDAAVLEFEAQFEDKGVGVVVVADLMYQNHVIELVRRLKELGYSQVLGTEVVRDPTGLIPNRKIASSSDDTLDETTLKTYSLFHISDPPPSLLLALYNRFTSLHVLSTPSAPSSKLTLDNPTLRTAALLRRRFARVLSLASAGVIGILVNTLSVANSLASIDHLRRRIASAGKKSYTVVVGRLNPAKLANFSEVEGWVVVGCWEGGLVGGDTAGGGEYWRPVVTPFELEVALMGEDERVWGGEWWGGTEKLKLEDSEGDGANELPDAKTGSLSAELEVEDVEGGVEGEESLPPEFDLRTGKLVSHSRPMRLAIRSSDGTNTTDKDSANSTANTALVQRSRPGELASVNGVASPGAEYLRSQRTWQGLGTDFAEGEDARSTAIEEGRSGIARGYTVAEGERH